MFSLYLFFDLEKLQPQYPKNYTDQHWIGTTCLIVYSNLNLKSLILILPMSTLEVKLEMTKCMADITILNIPALRVMWDGKL